MEKPTGQYKYEKKLELKNLKEELPKKFKKIYCPSCNDEVTANDINQQNGISKCSSCHVIFSIEKEMADVKTKNEIQQNILRPEGIDLFYYGDELDITLNQHIQGLNAWFIAFTPLIALGTLLNFFLAENPISIYFPIGFSLIAAYYLYKAVIYSKYKTYIDVNNRFLSIKNRPKNFRADKTYAADEIDQLYLKPSSEAHGHYVIYVIINGLEGQKHEKLITVTSLSKAKYLEQEIEKYLDIKDREVPEAKI